MSLTVAELLHSEEFKEYKIIAGENGANRKVNTVTVMDAPDIYQWLRGGEILITTGYLFKDDISFLENLIIKINEAGAAALFIKLGRFINQLPEAVDKLSEKLAFPIVFMPLNCAFTDVINPVLKRIIWEQSKIIEYSNQIHNTFIELAMKGKEVNEIVEKVSELLNIEVTYMDLLEDIEKKEEIVRKERYTYFPINYKHKIYGYLIFEFEKSMLNEYQQIILEHASTIIKLQIQQKISNLQIEKKYRDQFVRDIVYNNIKSYEEIECRGKKYKWYFEGKYRVIIIDIDQLKKEYSLNRQDIIDEKSNAVLEYAIHIFEERISQVIYTIFSDHAVLVMQENDEMEKNQRNLWIRHIMEKTHNKTGYTISVVIGSKKEDIKSVHKSFQEASYALHLIEKREKREEIVYYEDMGLDRLMDLMKDDTTMKRYSSTLIDKIQKIDMDKQTDYRNTMEMIIYQNWNLKEAAQMMYIHYNTMKNRYHKIEEALQVDFDNMQDRILVELAFRFRKTQNDVFEEQ